MDAFKNLSIGTKFSGTSNRSVIALFQQGKTGQDAVSAPVTDASGSTGMSAAMQLPAPSFSLSILGKSNDSRGSGGAGGEAHDAHKAEDDKPLKPMTAKKVRNIWRKNDLQVTGVDVPSPIQHFSDLARPPLCTPHHVVNNLFAREHKVPTPIQMQAIPALIHRRDVLACAPTGSGKTIAFLVPMFTLLKEPDPQVGIRALIVTPTIELALQIEREAFFLMRGKRWRLVQHSQTTRNKDIFVSTPGRILSLVQQKLLDLSKVQYLVFDEGDRLWDTKTDFLEAIDGILAACTAPEKVVSLFTATMSERVETAARSVMSSDPVRIIVRGRQRVSTSVKQRLLFCGSEQGKIVAMRNLVKEGIKPPVLVFVQSIERSKELYDEIRAQGLHMAVMNAKMSIEEREETVTQFRLGRIWVLVTTELLSRGIDFKNVGTVINFDFPITVDSYIHRVGRTGRAGKSGEAISFFTEDDRERLPAIAKVIKDSGNEVEDWMLEIKVGRSERRRLQRTTPRRMIISTKKRMIVADKRLERQYNRMEREEKEEAEKKRLAKEEKKKGKKSRRSDETEADKPSKKRRRSEKKAEESSD